MIRDVAALLRTFQESEMRLIDRAGIKHPPTIGAMYEGLTADVLTRSIPRKLNLQVVSGFIEDGHGGLSGQIDSMLVAGSPTSIPHTAQVKCHVKDVIAVLEVKKTLFSVELADAHQHLRAVLDLYGQHLLRGGEKSFDVGSALSAYSQITGLVAPQRAELSTLPFDLEMLYRGLIVELISPVRILFGYSGFASEFTFRQAFTRLVERNMRKHGFGPTSFPQLIVSGKYSLIKTNGQPYIAPLINGEWPFLVSSSRNPLTFLLELIWTRLSHRYLLSPWYDNFNLERVNPVLSCKAIERNGAQGWHYNRYRLSKKYLLQKIKDREWRPAKLNLAQFTLVNHLCRYGSQKLNSRKFQAFLAANRIDLERQIPKLKSTRLAGVYKGELRLVTEKCMCVITPGGDYVAGENSSGQLEQWVLKQLQRSRSGK
jgi:hypothetical protein